MPFDVQARARLGGADSDEIQLIFAKQHLVDLMDALVAVGPNPGPWSPTIKVHGYQNPLLYTENTLTGDLTESSFLGYAATDLDALVAALDGNGNVVAFADLSAPFFVNDNTDGQVLAGLYLTYAGGGLIGGFSIDPGLTLIPGQIIPFSLTLQLGNS